ncbi:CvpA family protein [candidate division WOR-3 bacterium]|nr:CvpA family protein [candidate division WOR-3 bacterium]
MNLTTPVILDGVAVLLIIVIGLLGLSKGAIKILGGLAGFIAAIMLGWRFTPALAALIGPRINSEIFGKILAFLAIFIGVMLVTALVVFLLSKLFDAILLGWLNKLLGFIIGAIFGVVIVTALVWVSLQVAPTLYDIYSQTKIIRLFLNLFFLVFKDQAPVALGVF